MTNMLRFETLRRANTARLPEFKNAKGGAAHTSADGSDWTPLEWAGAMAGEAGEAANVAKKIRRGDLTGDEARSQLAKELADVVCYADILAMQLGIDLGEAVQEKFNEVSRRVSSTVFIEAMSEGGTPNVVRVLRQREDVKVEVAS